MSLEINPVAAQMAGLPAAEPGAVGQTVRSHDIAAFRESMAQQASMMNTVAPADPATLLPPSSLSESQGFRSVAALLDNLNGDVERLNSQAAPFTAGEKDMSPGDMLALTVRCHEFLFHCQLTSNVANRSSEGVQQLFRQQS